MTPRFKSFLKKALIVNLVVILGILGFGAFFIASNCTTDCDVRGELLGQGLVRFVLFCNFIMGLWWYFKIREKS